MRHQTKAPKDKSKPRPESDRLADDFVSVARRLECDEDKATFEEKLGKIAKTPPQPSSDRTAKRRSS